MSPATCRVAVDMVGVVAVGVVPDGGCVVLRR